MELILFTVLCGFATAQFGGFHVNIPTSSRNNMEFHNDLASSCTGQSQCVPISACPLIEDLLDTSCLSSDRYFHRLNALTCGHSSSEDFVCCPPGGHEALDRPGPGGRQRDCGETLVRGDDYEGVGAQPWVARIGFTNQDSGKVRFACTGSIISRSVVLTAAHCALAKPEGYKLSSVVVGEWDTERSPDCNELLCAAPAQSVRVAQVVAHPGYEQSVFRHDIALLQLRENIQFTLTAAPVCLNDLADDLVGQKATLVGWGKLSGQVATLSRQQQLEVPIMPLSSCEAVFGGAVPVHEGQLCAGGEEGRDACSGFGGAPLLVRRGGRRMQVGIVSFGSENCGSAGVPSVYTNIAHYYRWIVENAQL